MCDEQLILSMQRQLKRLARQLQNAGVMPRSNATGDPCGGGLPSCPSGLVSPDQEALIKGGTRTQQSTVTGILAAGASYPDITIASNGLRRTVVLADLIASAGIPDLDAIRITVFKGGQEKFSLNGGVFGRGNANACTTSCGYSVCLYPIESLTIRITNQSAAAFIAADYVKLDTRSIYAGEPGFDCPECIEPGAVPGAGVGFQEP